VGETAGPLDETDVDPCELFVAVGMLVLESRLPTASVKGRRDGLHCPQAVGHWSSHECDLTQPQVVDSYSVIRRIACARAKCGLVLPTCVSVALFPKPCEN